MNTEATPGSPAPAKSVWYYNLPAFVLLLFVSILMNTGPLSQIITAACLCASLVLSYVSVRIRINFGGVLFLLASAYILAVFMTLTLSREKHDIRDEDWSLDYAEQVGREQSD